MKHIVTVSPTYGSNHTHIFSFTPHYQLPITNYQLPITNYQLPITNYQLPITNYQLPITNYQFNMFLWTA
ncbi:MAG: hypothetical protein QNJ47_08985 [Nostocaceae cyanobacterium]|nr:hypothetical protein [Nostocaceae cyanobacterium]